jgi:hypothetical protein
MVEELGQQSNHGGAGALALLGCKGADGGKHDEVCAGRAQQRKVPRTS